MWGSKISHLLEMMHECKKMRGEIREECLKNQYQYTTTNTFHCVIHSFFSYVKCNATNMLICVVYCKACINQQCLLMLLLECQACTELIPFFISGVVLKFVSVTYLKTHVT